MGKRLTNWLLLSILTAGLIIGCGSFRNDHSQQDMDTSVQSQIFDCRTVEHDLGITEVCGEPQKIAVLSLHMLDLLLSLGVEPAGCTLRLQFYSGDVFDNPAQQIPYLGDRLTTQPVNLGDAGSPSLERLIALKPDLIIGEARNSDEYKLLTEIAPTLIWKNRTIKGQWVKTLGDIATALGKEEQAEKVITQYESQIIQARTDLAEVVKTYPKLLLLGANRLGEGVYMITPDSYLGELLGEIGFQLISPSSPSPTPNAPISLEALPTLNDADTIIILGYNLDTREGLENSKSSADMSVTQRVETHQVKTIKQDWEENAIAQSLTASQENRVYFATYAKWNGLNGPIGAELVLEQLREFLLQN